MTTFNVGILGVSNIATKKFIPSLLKTKKIKIKFVASRKKNKAKKIADKLNCSYGKYNDLFKNSKDLDIVYISTPPNKRIKYYKQCIDHQLHIFSEKPAFINLNDAKKIISLCNKKNIFFF